MVFSASSLAPCRNVAMLLIDLLLRLFDSKCCHVADKSSRCQPRSGFRIAMQQPEAGGNATRLNKKNNFSNSDQGCTIQKAQRFAASEAPKAKGAAAPGSRCLARTSLVMDLRRAAQPLTHITCTCNAGWLLESSLDARAEPLRAPVDALLVMEGKVPSTRTAVHDRLEKRERRPTRAPIGARAPYTLPTNTTARHARTGYGDAPRGGPKSRAAQGGWGHAHMSELLHGGMGEEHSAPSRLTDGRPPASVPRILPPSVNNMRGGKPIRRAGTRCLRTAKPAATHAF
ncbi:hypothetical protein PHYSODRAFT_304262 [Phytophthora sojae]|uniref:Uncharacterized protein n=1 Tax=Phytophthora sojae (strain P6497) TaxID=1094619 RepID=G4ZYB2_PHYSP|nr:hypothetical protein PHYSODRAFT_304262 [Phytophthora sojae]EGZ12724.1 hypothetical protein PHYSODRAFT_304262 [Phytophthora sojae]|eukprot:XP_009533057.1 hypothetical protein PHYSODRAFT_304262 [Phytophthora sojae]